MLKISKSKSSEKKVTLLLEGRISNHGTEQLSGLCEEILAQGNHLTLDFSGVSFVSWKGVGVLQHFERRQVALVNCSGFVAEQLKIRKSEKQDSRM